MRSSTSWILIHVLWFCASLGLAQQDARCSAVEPCRVGCCSSQGSCGFTEEHCGTGCQGNCDAKAECGQYAAEGDFDCPINVCCSKHGFCGVTELFCGDGCQKNSKGEGCGQPSRPSCPSNTDALTYEKRIGYYELFTKGRSCGVKEPEDVPLGPFTHINLAFVNFDANFELVDEHSDWIRRMVIRKLRYPDLRINIAIGGWAFNDPPTDRHFSNMASSRANRLKFINSVVSYLRRYALDGVDIDWEYPVADDRGGKEEDRVNYVSLLSELRDAFSRENANWEISIAVPSSYWYLRGFDLPGLQKHVDHFNLMTYDIYGMWDRDNKWTGPYLKGHTDWSQIELGLDLLWRNGVDSKKVVMGFAFYGRSFTMASGSCYQPNGVCQFTDGGIPGDCSDTAGVLTYQEVASRNSTLDVGTFYDAENTVKYNVFGGNQWVSYDDAVSFRDKLDRLSRRCLAGLMIWAIDQDTSKWDAMRALFGDYSGLELEGLNSGDAERLSDLFGQFNGQGCFVTAVCTDGTSGQLGPDQVCPAGTSSVNTAHNPLQRGGFRRIGDCSEGWYRHICCPSRSMPQNCAWNGGQRSPVGQGGRTCGSECGDGKFELNSDNFLSATGGGMCTRGNRKLCCDSTLLFDQCFWNNCQGPLLSTENPTCPDDHEFLTWRYNRPSGSGLCREEYVSPVSGNRGSPIKEPFRSALCCPKGRSFSKCNWSNNAQPRKPGEVVAYNPDKLCLPSNCERWQVKVADATDPPPGNEFTAYNKNGCNGYSLPPGFDPHFPFCCEPPSTFNKDWPVDPEYLWEFAFSNPDTDSAVWDYSNHHEYNDEDRSRSPDGQIDGDDAYGFLMLNGPEEALDDNFSTSQTVVRRSAAVPRVKRQIVTNNHTLIDSTFDHKEEVFHVYCNYPAGSPQCERVFKGGVEDTIIKLPDHVGAGPFARIVSMVVVPDYDLPSHHLEHRSVDGLHGNPVYEVKVDYNFHLARQDRGQVNMRVDFTNLLGYWDELTNTPASRIKRSYDYEGFTMSRFRERVNRGEETTKRLGKRGQTIKTKFPVDLTPDEYSPSEPEQADTKLAKRWFGTFVNWLRRLTTISGDEVGNFPLDWRDRMNLFKARFGCPGRTTYASLDIDLEAELLLQATYAYYYSATIIPFPEKPDMYFYFGIEPEAYLGLYLRGYAQMRGTTQRRRLIDTIGFPGLSIPGIAAVGPTLDVDGEMRALLSISGEAKAGARLKMGRAQAYWPQNDRAVEQFDKLGVSLKEDPEIPDRAGLVPVFEAGVGVSAEVDILIRPQANIGIQIGGGKLTGGKEAVRATVTAFLESMLQLRASGFADLVKGTFDYTYGVYLRYNLGFEATVSILAGWINWATVPRLAYNPARTIPIYEQKGSINMKAGSSPRSLERRMVRLTNEPQEFYDNMTLWSDNPENMDNLFKRQTTGTDPDGDTNPQIPKLQGDITCPPQSGGRDWRLPELRSMPSRDVNGNDFDTSCDGFRQLTWPQTWTHDPNTARTRNRRTAACGREALRCPIYRSRAQSAARASSGYNFQCDETPMGSTEEGGTFLNDRVALCIPAIDNNNAGQCNRLLSDVLESNVGKMHWSTDIPLDQRVDSWQGWADGPTFWTTTGVQAGTARQDLVPYPNRQPDPAGSPTRANENLGWLHKRNFTFNIINDGAQAANWFGATGKRFADSSYTFSEPTGFNSILCAVNIFGQTNFYRYRAGTSYNGYCRTNQAETSSNWPYYSMGRCFIDFGTATTKRSVDGNGTWADWDIKSVTMVDKPEDRIIVPLHPDTPLEALEEMANAAFDPQGEAAALVEPVEVSDNRHSGAQINRTNGHNDGTTNVHENVVVQAGMEELS